MIDRQKVVDMKFTVVFERHKYNNIGGEEMAKQSTNPNIWTRRTEETIPIKKMEDIHIIRAMRCLEGYAEDRERKLRMRLSVVVNNPDSCLRTRRAATQKLAILDANGYPIGDVWIQYPKLCEEAVSRGLLT